MRLIKAETTKIEKASKQTEDAAEELEQSLPQLEAAAEGMANAEVTVEFIKEGVIQGGEYGAIGRKIIQYQSKEKAIQDCIMALRDNEKLNVDDTMKMIRRLSAKQFKNMVKARRLINFCQTGSVHGMQQQMGY